MGKENLDFLCVFDFSINYCCLWQVHIYAHAHAHAHFHAQPFCYAR